jgi:DHA2 family multidrug resistance protein-like MFS transporter
MLPVGALGDRYRRRRLLLLGLAVVGAASQAAAWAAPATALIAVRAAMDVGAAIIMPTVLAVLFDERERGKTVALVVGDRCRAAAGPDCRRGGCRSTSGGAPSS